MQINLSFRRINQAQGELAEERENLGAKKPGGESAWGVTAKGRKSHTYRPGQAAIKLKRLWTA